MDEKAVVEKLVEIKLFGTLKDDEERMTLLASISKWQKCRAGDEVIGEGMEGSELYILYRGKVSVHKRTLDREPYNIVILRDYEDDFLGELALMDREVRSASVTAETDFELNQRAHSPQRLDLRTSSEPQSNSSSTSLAAGLASELYKMANSLQSKIPCSDST